MTALRRSMPRDAFFASLCILACANGLGSKVIESVDRDGWPDALLSTFGISAIVFIACAAGVSFILRESSDEMRSADLVVGAGVLVLVILPVGATSWLALTVLSLYILLFTNAASSQRRGAVILLSTTVPMLWSRLLFWFFASSILEIDASLVGWLLGTDRVGNMVRFADNSEHLVIFPGCSSLANMSLAFLCWVTISQSVRHQWSPQDVLWCLLALVSVVAVNVSRLSLMGLSVWHYQAAHNQWGDMLANTLILGLAVGISMLGVRRELFSRT
jgi:exosortase/archaeosortase family protein